MTATQEALAAMNRAEKGMNRMIDEIVESSETFVQECKEQKMPKPAFEQAQDRAQENFEKFMQEREAGRGLDDVVSEAIWLLQKTDPFLAKYLNKALGKYRKNRVK